MRYTEGISYRMEQEAPTTEGWYYGKILGGSIVPVYVFQNTYHKLWAKFDGITYPLENVRWYGSLLTVVEG